MQNLQTIIIIKNIPIQTVEQLIKQVITPDFFENDLQEIVFNLKNSRIMFLSFPNTISNTSFRIIANKLIQFNDNQISKPEILAIYKNELVVKQPESLNINSSIESLILHYKLNIGPLHQMLVLNKNNYRLKKWWQFWK